MQRQRLLLCPTGHARDFSFAHFILEGWENVRSSGGASFARERTKYTHTHTQTHREIEIELEVESARERDSDFALTLDLTY